MTRVSEADPHVLAAAWVAVDPDPHTRADAESLIASGADLDGRFRGRLAFGTAGLRGELGAGPQRMNRVLVRVVAAAIGSRVLQETDDPLVVVGFDARHMSECFAQDTARVLAAGGVRCTLLPRPLPTPVLAFSVRHLGAAAGVMVTASHNPRTDNGYKVYWADGAQVTTPIDREISELIDATELLGEADLATLDHEAISTADDSLVQAYVEAAASLLDPASPRTAEVAYTPLHGVGGEVVARAFAQAGFPAPAPVGEQAEPDPDFPTAPFPNPEETGVLDPLLATASATGAMAALANDPDADRLAVAVPNGPEWRLLTGDELGCLLAEHQLVRHGRRTPSTQGLVVTTVVSSSLLGEMARHHGVRYVETLTGFKWIMHARDRFADHGFLFGYEEALGYAVSDMVRDKDGVTAALVAAELISELAADGRTLLDLLDDLHRRHGVHVTGQRSIRFEESDGPPLMTVAMDALRKWPPTSLGDHRVLRVVDLAPGTAELPPANAVIIEVDGGRIVARPSGTEPKMKVYGEVRTGPGGDLAWARLWARATLVELLDAAIELVAAANTSPAANGSPAANDTAGAEPAVAARPGPGAEPGPRAEPGEQPRRGARARDLRLIVRCLDLDPDGADTPGRVRARCARARRPDPADATVGPVAGVTARPPQIALARTLTAGSPVGVVGLAGAYPDAGSHGDLRAADLARAVELGASAVDVVLDRAAFLAGPPERTADDLAALRAAAGNARITCILEAGELPSAGAVRDACELALAAGVDAVGTATGGATQPAPPWSVEVVAEALAAHHRRSGVAVGLKIGCRPVEALAAVAVIRSVLGEDWLTPERLRFGGPGLLVPVLADLAATEGALRAGAG